MVQNCDQHQRRSNTQQWPPGPPEPRAYSMPGIQSFSVPRGSCGAMARMVEVRRLRHGWSDKNRGKASSETKLAKLPGAEMSKDERTDLVPL